MRGRFHACPGEGNCPECYAALEDELRGIAQARNMKLEAVEYGVMLAGFRRDARLLEAAAQGFSEKRRAALLCAAASAYAAASWIAAAAGRGRVADSLSQEARRVLRAAAD